MVVATRTNRICTNPALAQFTGPGLDHPDHPELARRVIGLSEISGQPDDRRSIQDHARLLLEHDVDDRLRAVVRALEVDVDDPIELIFGHVLELGIGHDPGVVDQHVDLAAALVNRTYHCLDARHVGHVHGKRHRLATHRFDHAGGVFSSLGVHVTDRHDGTFLRKLDGRRLTDTASGARDDGNLTC
jgi:hypothetical protein